MKIAYVLTNTLIVMVMPASHAQGRHLNVKQVSSLVAHPQETVTSADIQI